MRTTAAAIAVAYELTFKKSMPSDLAYVTAGKDVINKVGLDRARALFTKCENTLKDMPNVPVRDVAHIMAVTK